MGCTLVTNRGTPKKPISISVDFPWLHQFLITMKERRGRTIEPGELEGVVADLRVLSAIEEIEGSRVSGISRTKIERVVITFERRIGSGRSSEVINSGRSYMKRREVSRNVAEGQTEQKTYFWQFGQSELFRQVL